MQSGVLNQESLNEMLRSISQRRRQGMLEITLDQRALKMHFVQGRIIEFHNASQTPIQETVEKLMQAGFPCEDPNLYEEKTYAELLSRLETELPSDKTVSREVLQHVIKHRVLDLLYSLNIAAGAFYTFKVQMVELERDFSPSISVGQLLLDMVELPECLEEFNSKFPPGTVVKLTGAKSEGDNDDERALLEVIGSGAAVEELKSRAMLSSFNFAHSMLELESSGVISTLAERDEDSAELVSDMSQFMESSIDAAFGFSEPDISSPDASLEPIEKADNNIENQQIEPQVMQEVVITSNQVKLSTAEKARIYLAPKSAELLQSTVVPAVTAICFLVLALVLPFVSWFKIFAAFAG